MKRKNIGFLIFMLIVGFAAVATTIVINGTFNLSFDNTDFTSNIVFTKAETKDGTATIDNNEQNITFETKKLETVGDTAVLEYEVTNKSRQYNTSVTINYELKESFSSFNEYLEITNDITSPFELESGKSKKGKLTIKLKSAYTVSDTTVELLCTLSASPISRDNIGDKYDPTYKDPILNGADPVLDNNKTLVPVKLSNDGTVTYADKNKEWYNYANKEWANAIILVGSPSKTYNVGDAIKESDIESYFVWIPRFKYQIFNTGNYTSYIDSSLPSESIAKEIQVIFEEKDTEISTGTEVGSWLTHPAFTNYGTNGIWVGKFETGYKGAASTSSAKVDAIDASKVIIKPNVYSWRGISVSNMFKTAFNYEKGMTSHMMRNTEWGAIAYLSHSNYGINDEVRINNNSAYLTGYAATTKDESESTTNNSPYNTEIGYLASTTGNITGVYDMSGGAREYVAGYRANTPASSGFTTAELTTYARHLDVYNTSSSVNSYNYRILGDATGEMGPFYKSGDLYINNWYGDYSHFVKSDSPWFLRGGHYDSGSGASQFNFSWGYGGKHDTRTFRITLAPKS